MRSALFPAFCVFTVMATAGHAADVTRKVTVDAAPEEVWAYVGAWCAIGEWYPGIDSCSEEKIDGATHRRLKAGDAEFLEKRLARDDAGRNYSYAILEGPLPVRDYTATFAVEDDGGNSVVVWTSSFEPEGASEDEAVEAVGGIYDVGLEAIRQHFGQ